VSQHRSDFYGWFATTPAARSELDTEANTPDTIMTTSRKSLLYAFPQLSIQISKCYFSVKIEIERKGAVSLCCNSQHFSQHQLRPGWEAPLSSVRFLRKEKRMLVSHSLAGPALKVFQFYARWSEILAFQRYLKRVLILAKSWSEMVLHSS